MSTDNTGDVILTEPEKSPDDAENVGLAWLADDGILVLQLKVLFDDGRTDQVFIEIEPTDPKFARVLAHLGGLRYGENKHIKPFGDDLLA